MQVSAYLILKNRNPKTFNDITQSIKHYIQFLLADPRLKPVLFEYWHKLLSSPNEQLVKRLTDLIIFSMEEFGLDEQDMMVQEAIRVHILLDDRKDPRSPFKFYKELQEKRSQLIDLDEIKVLQERFDGQKLCLNFFYFQKLSRENSEGGVQFKNLPAYSKNFLSKMTESLEKKLGDDLRLASYITNTFAQEYAVLKAGALGSNYLQNLLNVEGSADAFVPRLQASSLPFQPSSSPCLMKHHQGLFHCAKRPS
jgi:hypothetical protein